MEPLLFSQIRDIFSNPLTSVVARAIGKAMADNTSPPEWALRLLSPELSPQDNARPQQLTAAVGQVNARNVTLDLTGESNSAAPLVNPPLSRCLLINTCTNARTWCIRRTRTQQARYTHSSSLVNHEHMTNARFTRKATDLPASLKLEGLPHEDVPELIVLYQAHIRLPSHDDVSESIIDHRTIKYLALLVRGVAAQSLRLTLSPSLEWTPESQLASLEQEGNALWPHLRKPGNSGSQL